MRVVVSDASCLIDLRKASLLEAFVRIPYELVIPYPSFHDELVRFTPAQRDLLARGMDIRDVPGSGVERAIELAGDIPALTVNDCFAYVLAETIPNSTVRDVSRAVAPVRYCPLSADSPEDWGSLHTCR
jgi:hypothetical protein